MTFEDQTQLGARGRLSFATPASGALSSEPARGRIAHRDPAAGFLSQGIIEQPIVTLDATADVDASAIVTATGQLIHSATADVDAGAVVTAVGTEETAAWDNTLNGLTPAFLGPAMLKPSFTPEWMWLTDEVSGATELVAGGLGNLIDRNSPTKQAFSPTLNATVTQLADGTLQGMECSDSAVGAAPVDQVGVSIVHVPALATGVSVIIDNIDGPPNDGLLWYGNGGTMLIFIRPSGGGAAQASIGVSGLEGTPLVVMYTYRASTGLISLYVPGGSATAASPGGPISTGAGTNLSMGARPGSDPTWQPWGGDHGMHAIFNVANASLWGETERKNLAVELSYETP